MKAINEYAVSIIVRFYPVVNNGLHNGVFDVGNVQYICRHANPDKMQTRTARRLT